MSLISNGGSPSTLTLGLTWNGSPVVGHTIGWRIAEIWDVNQNEIYADTGSPPSGYATLGQSPSASPTNGQGLASQTIQGGANAGYVVVAARDLSVVGAITLLNPEAKAEVGVSTDILLKSISFIQDDHTLYNGSLFDARTTLKGKPYPKVQWTAKSDPVPMTIPAQAYALVVIVHLSVSNNIAANTPVKLQGTSGENALNFLLDAATDKTAVVSPGDDVTLQVTAVNPLGTDIRKVVDSIKWTIALNGAPAVALDPNPSGPHTIYTTFGTPADGGTDGSAMRTPDRMDIVIQKLKGVSVAAKGPTNYAAILLKLNNLTGAYYQFRSLIQDPKQSPSGAINAWALPMVSDPTTVAKYGDTDPNKGADCRSCSQFYLNVAKCAGMPGTFQTTKYAALYVSSDPKLGANGAIRPTLAVANLVLGSPDVTPGADSVNAAGKTWVLTLADANCLNPKDGTVAAGQKTTVGPLGLNAFENALVYTDPSTKKTWYFPGGTSYCFSDVNKVVQIFQTMAWVDLKTQVVQFVDYQYAAPANEQP